MSSSSSDAALTDAAYLGTAAGLRSMTPGGVLALRGAFGDSPLTKVLPVLAAGELVGDKLPVTPPRSAPGPLFGRAAAGALLGFRRGGAQAGVAGAACAIVAAYGGQHTRAWVGEKTGASPILIAVVEDALAVALALAGSRAR